MVQDSDALMRLDELPGEMSAHSCGNVLIACWPRISNVRSVKRLAKVRRRYLDNHPEGASLIHIGVDPSVPDGPTSAAWVEMMKCHADRIHCIGVVIPAHGFQASAVRSWVTKKRTLQAPGPFKMRFHTTVDELLTWLPEEHERRTGVRLNRPALLRYLRDLVEVTLASAPTGDRSAV